MTTRSRVVEIPVDGQRIDGTIVAPDTLVPGVLLVHGWDGTQDQYIARAHEIAAMGSICLTFDLRGHVRHQDQRETVSREQNLHDVLAAYDVLAQHPAVDRQAIAIVGSSYGAYLAAIASAMRPVCWLGLRVPALYADEDWDVPKAGLDRAALRAYRNSVVTPERNRALAAMSEFRGDVLIVESEHDHLVPHQTVQNYKAACVNARSLTYRVIVGADHALSEKAWQQTYTSVLVDWVGEMVFSARAGKVGKAAQGAQAPQPVSRGRD